MKILIPALLILLVLPLVTAVPTITSFMSSNGMLSFDSTYVGESLTYRVYFSDVNGLTIIPITPADGGECMLLVQNATTGGVVSDFAMNYGPTADDGYNIETSFSEPGTYNVTAICTNGVEQQTTTTVQVIKPEPTVSEASLSYYKSGGEETNTAAAGRAIVYHVFYSDLDVETGAITAALPVDGGRCFINIDKVDNSDNVLFNYASELMEYNETSENYDFTTVYSEAGRYLATITCSNDNSVTNTFQKITQVVSSIDPEPTSLTVTDSVSLGAIRGPNEDVVISAIYSGEASGEFTDASATCSYAITRNSDGLEYGNGSLTYDPVSGSFVKTISNLEYLDDYLDFGIGAWVRNSYNVEVSCENIDANKSSAIGYSSFSLVSDSCNNNRITGNATLIEDMMCMEPSGAMFLFSSSTGGQVLDCGGHTLTNVGSNEDRYGIFIQSSAGVTIQNCKFSGFGVAIHAINGSGYSLVNVTIDNSIVGIATYDTNNSAIQNVTITGTTTGIFIANSTNNIVNDISIDNVNTGIAVTGNNNSIYGVEINAASYGITLRGANNIFDSVSITNSNLSLEISGNGNSYSNLNITNSTGVISIESEDANYAAIEVSGNENSFYGVEIIGSGGDGVVVSGANNAISNLEVANVTGSGVVFSSGATGNSVTESEGVVVSASGNSSYYLVYPQSLFINASGVILNFTDIDTGALPFDLTQLYNYITVAPSFVYVNSTAMPSLSRPAVIILTGTSYANVDSFNILRDGAICSAPQCVKVSNNPVTFSVTGFSNYTTQTVAPVVQSPAPAGGAAAGGAGGLGASGSSSPKVNTTNSTGATAKANNTTTTNTGGSATSATGVQSGSQGSSTNANSNAGSSSTVATGLFTLDQLKGTTGAYMGVAVVLVLLGIGYFVFVRK